MKAIPTGAGTARDGAQMLRARSHRIAVALAHAYGSPNHHNKTDPLDELIFIILSQMTTHWSFERVFERLKGDNSDWAAVLTRSVDEVRDLIQDAGLSNQKAPRIRQIIETVIADFGEASLDGLRSWPDADVQGYLVSLPGVGIKTAKCVMMYALGRDVLPVDTHVYRVSRRLGLLPPDLPAPLTHVAIEAVVAPRDRYSFHVNAIAHGRSICLPKRPRCPLCPVRRLCATPHLDISSAVSARSPASAAILGPTLSH